MTPAVGRAGRPGRPVRARRRRAARLGLLLLLAGLAGVPAGQAQAQAGDAATIAELRRQLEEMRKRLEQLEARAARRPPTVAAAPAPTPSRQATQAELRAAQEAARVARQAAEQARQAASTATAVTAPVVGLDPPDPMGRQDFVGEGGDALRSDLPGIAFRVPGTDSQVRLRSNVSYSWSRQDLPSYALLYAPGSPAATALNRELQQVFANLIWSPFAEQGPARRVSTGWLDVGLEYLFSRRDFHGGSLATGPGTAGHGIANRLLFGVVARF